LRRDGEPRTLFRFAGEKGGSPVDPLIVNPSTPPGPRDVQPTPTDAIIVDAMNGRMPASVDTGLNLVHVDGVPAAHFLALEPARIGGRHILRSENLTLRHTLLAIAELTRAPAPLFRIPHPLAMSIASVPARRDTRIPIAHYNPAIRVHP
jgi:dihydroflavonol-4-reductase